LELKDSVVSADITGSGTAGNGLYNYVGGRSGDVWQKPGKLSHAHYRRVHQNCRSTGGNVSGLTEGSLTNVFAGGIAGGPQGSWPYIGGIVGNNYYGGLVSQCWFNGTIKAGGNGIGDYTGGIAEYNSK
jgi:hypothetical protein